MHVSGAMSPGASGSFTALLDELASFSDAEHPDVAVQHESGLGLTVLGDWRVIVEDVEGDYGPVWAQFTEPGVVLEAMRRVASGEAELADLAYWQPGYPPG